MTQQEQIQTILQALMSAGGGLSGFQSLSNPALSQMPAPTIESLRDRYDKGKITGRDFARQMKALGVSGDDPEGDELERRERERQKPTPAPTPRPTYPRGSRAAAGSPADMIELGEVRDIDINGTPEWSKNDAIRHKTLDRYINDPNVNLNDPKVVDLLRLLGLTDSKGGMFPSNMDLMEYFRGPKQNPPPDEELYPGFTSIPKGTQPIARGAYLYENKPPPKPARTEREEIGQFHDDLYERMKQRVILDYFNGILKLPMNQDEEPSQGTPPISMYFQPIAQLIHTMANGGM